MGGAFSQGGTFGGGGSQPIGNGGVGAGGTQPVGTGGNVTTNPNGAPTNLPTATNCPTLTNGATVQIARKNGSMMPVVIYIDPAAKSKPDPGGPIINYWHATGSSPIEVHSGFGDANIQKVTSMGGVVAAYTTTACSGCSTTDDLVWFVEDDDVQDTLVACAIQQAKIDTRRIHALGWSAGALHSDHVALARNNYMASVISYSGGALFPVTIPDPSNHVATIQTYGTTGDAVVIDFPTQSKSWYNTYQPQGWYTMMCKHAGGHMIDSGVAPMSLQFFMDHPYKVSPEPYANAIPPGFPSYCGNTIQ
jgi:predicted esterase